MVKGRATLVRRATASLAPKHGPKVNKDTGRTVHGDTAAARAAALVWLTKNASVAKQPLDTAIRKVRAAGAEIGVSQAAALIPGAAMVADAKPVTNWKKWSPSAADTSAMTDMLDDRIGSVPDATDGIKGTTLVIMAYLIGEAVSYGRTAGEAAAAIDARFDDPARADMVTLTETVAATEAAARIIYEANGVSEWTWVSQDGACDECAGLNGDVFAIDSGEAPPLHPNCQCESLPIGGGDATMETDSEE